MSCPICFCDKKMIILECTHKICLQCLSDWSYYNKDVSCPSCRRSTNYFNNVNNFVCLFHSKLDDMIKKYGNKIKKDEVNLNLIEEKTNIPMNVLMNFIEHYILNNKFQNVWKNKEMKMIKKYFKNCFLETITTLDILLMSEKEFQIYETFLKC